MTINMVTIKAGHYPGHWRHIGYRHGKPLYRWTPGKPIND